MEQNEDVIFRLVLVLVNKENCPCCSQMMHANCVAVQSEHVFMVISWRTSSHQELIPKIDLWSVL